ncbi:AI-2E family transporter [Alsobacter metallidurans]|uniref:AI-2E family transporter n=1 Tax=Alsobacter metallidurans TaxID=340221 RepID=A0A917IA82_9HYPH|nr:AI-2E family transporter [Alsobacter metallidurans]GGH31544.1 AI-2E family transporter [Alsobacter metallidurans]
MAIDTTLPETQATAPDNAVRSAALVSEGEFARRVTIAALVVGAIVVLFAVLYAMLDVLLLGFAAALIAVVLRSIADGLEKHTPLSPGFALLVAGVLVFGALGVAIWLFQAQVAAQLATAAQTATGALEALGQKVGAPDLANQISGRAKEILSGQSFIGKVTTYGVSALGAVTDLVLVIFGGVYLALDPKVYRRGVVMLFPAQAREHVDETMGVAGRALRLWLLGQLLAMVVTGALTWGALAMIGLPSAAALGLIAGLLEFIPLVGPFAGAVPALLVASGMGLPAVLWTAAAFIAIQQVESNLIQPVVTRRSVAIPPALLLFAVIAFGALFGALGVLLAAPLAVVAFVAVKKLYVRETLGEATPVPGEKGAEHGSGAAPRDVA